MLLSALPYCIDAIGRQKKRISDANDKSTCPKRTREIAQEVKGACAAGGALQAWRMLAGNDKDAKETKLCYA